jgi:hypothetical protein
MAEPPEVLARKAASRAIQKHTCTVTSGKSKASTLLNSNNTTATGGGTAPCTLPPASRRAHRIAQHRLRHRSRG